MREVFNWKQKRISIFFVLLLICLSYLLVKTVSASNSQNKITIFHTNDIHGAFDSCYTPEGKLIQIGADIIKPLKNNTPNSILVDAGDSTQGGILASSSQGSRIIELMNEAGYDLMALGNHEFDYGVDALKLNSALANFKMISANVYNDEDEPLMKNESSNGCNTIIEMNGKLLGFFALTTPSTPYTTHPNNVKNLNFKDLIETAKEQCEYLKEQNVDVIICVAHLGCVTNPLDSTDSYGGVDNSITSVVLAKEVPEINIIIDGHSHEVYSKTVGHTYIQQTGSKSKNIGKIEIYFGENRDFNVNLSITKASDLMDLLEQNSPQYIPDAKISKMYRDMFQTASESFKTIIGKTNSCLFGGEYEENRICRLQDTNLGNLIADALVRYGKKFLSESKVAQNAHVVSLQNGGGIRSSISPGFISIGDIVNVFPFPNKISIKISTPNQLYSILENGFKSIYMENSILSGPDGAFPNVGGMKIEFDLNGEPMSFNEAKDKVIKPGSRVKRITLIDEEGNDLSILDRNDTKTQVILVTNNFETSGGDQYIMLKELPSLTDEGAFLKDLLCDHIKFLTLEHGEIPSYPVTSSRIKLVGSENLFTNYDATVKVRESSTELRNSEVQVQLDENPPFIEHTDENGNIIIKNLEQGPHNIRISRKNLSMDAYVNNRIGINSVDVPLENTTEQDITDVINIIDGIPCQKVSDIKRYVIFARHAYDSLPNESKPLIVNYSNLVAAEKASQILNPDINKNSQENIYKLLVITIIAILVLGSFLIINKIKDGDAKNKIVSLKNLTN